MISLQISQKHFNETCYVRSITEIWCKDCWILYAALQGVPYNGVWRHMEFLVHV